MIRFFDDKVDEVYERLSEPIYTIVAVFGILGGFTILSLILGKLATDFRNWWHEK